MKSVLFSATLILSTSAFGGVEFQSSELSAEMQNQITAAIAKACPQEFKVRISENKTVVRSDRMNENKVNTYYSTTFSINGSDQDGYHPRVTPLIVESLQRDYYLELSNEVRLVYGCGAPVNYQCIADQLQAFNSSVYYNLSSAEIHALLLDTSSSQHEIAVRAAVSCAR